MRYCLNTQDLSVAGYGMPSLSASGATIASPDSSSLKPELRFCVLLFLSWWGDNSFQFLETFAKVLTDGQSESCSWRGRQLQTLPPARRLIFALILTCKWNQPRILCDWTQSNQTSSFTRRKPKLNSLLVPGVHLLTRLLKQNGPFGMQANVKGFGFGIRVKILILFGLLDSSVLFRLFFCDIDGLPSWASRVETCKVQQNQNENKQPREKESYWERQCGMTFLSGDFWSHIYSFIWPPHLFVHTLGRNILRLTRDLL